MSGEGRRAYARQGGARAPGAIRPPPLQNAVERGTRLATNVDLVGDKPSLSVIAPSSGSPELWCRSVVHARREKGCIAPRQTPNLGLSRITDKGVRRPTPGCTARCERHGSAKPVHGGCSSRRLARGQGHGATHAGPRPKSRPAFLWRAHAELVEAWVIHRNTDTIPTTEGRLAICSRRRALYSALGHSTHSAQYPRRVRLGRSDRPNKPWQPQDDSQRGDCGGQADYPTALGRSPQRKTR
jgi:hypothetical protein